MVLRAYASTQDETYLADAARRMVSHLRANQALTPGWSLSKGGWMLVDRSLLTESWNPFYAALGFETDQEPPFLKPAMKELAKADVQS